MKIVGKEINVGEDLLMNHRAKALAEVLGLQKALRSSEGEHSHS